MRSIYSYYHYYTNVQLCRTSKNLEQWNVALYCLLNYASCNGAALQAVRSDAGVYNWRDGVARTVDESLTCVLNKNKLVKLAKVHPLTSTFARTRTHPLLIALDVAHLRRRMDVPRY